MMLIDKITEDNPADQLGKLSYANKKSVHKNQMGELLEEDSYGSEN